MAPASHNDFVNLSLPAAAARIRDAMGTKSAYVDRILRMANVTAVGIGFRNRDRQGLKELCLVCSVDRKRPLSELGERDRVPGFLGDFRVDVVASGRFRALASKQAGKQVERMRPVRPGLSIGHIDITAGTFGCVVERNGERLMLSNNHVLANGNKARLGSPILQPGKHDGGDPRKDAVARLVEFVPIVYDGEPDAAPPPINRPQPPANPNRPNTPAEPVGCGRSLAIFAVKARAAEPYNRSGRNRVDCALAKPDGAISTDILGIGQPRGVGMGALGMAVRKSGRTTGLTQGQIEQIDVTSRIEYDDRSATFAGQIMAGALSAGGDSGSAVLDMAGNVIGLLFAGSTTSTLINPIQDVLDALNVDLVTA